MRFFLAMSLAASVDAVAASPQRSAPSRPAKAAVSTNQITPSGSAPLDESLCGPKSSPEVESHKLNHINDRMPPVRHQNPAQWCAIFSAEAMLSFHNYLGAERLNPNFRPADFYRQKGRPSVVDMKAAATRYSDQRDSVDLEVGGVCYAPLYELENMNFQCRSEAALGFTSTLEDNSRAADLAKKVMSKYESPNPSDPTYSYLYGGKKMECRLPSARKKQLETDISNVLRSISAVCPRLQECASQAQTLNEKSQVRNYSQTVRGIPRDYQSRPFSVEQVSTSDIKSYFQKIKEVFAGGNGVPIEVGICGGDLPESGLDAGECGHHSVVITGAGWENGQCKVKIRNSWGPEWPRNGLGNGTLNVTADNFSKMLLKINKVKKTSNFRAVWISEKKPNRLREIGTAIQYQVPGYTFTGETKFQGSSQQFWNGTAVKDDGSRVVYRNGQMVQVEKIRLEDGSIFTGEVTSHGNSFSPKTGVIFKNGRQYQVREGQYSGH